MMNEEFMKRAIQLSEENVKTGNGGPFGAIVVKDGKIVGEGANCVTTSKDPTAHAEVQAIRQACKNLNTFDLSGAEIYTSCEPCPMCLASIYWARISKIYFGNSKSDAARIDFDDDFIYKEIPKPLTQRSIPIVQVLPDQAIRAFDMWEKSADKVPY